MRRLSSCCCPSSDGAGSCNATWTADDIPLACPECGGVEVELTGGDELVLESIEYRA